jgi:hypothetical protein
MGNLAQSLAGAAEALGPVATCIIVVVPCVAVTGCVWLISRVVSQIVAKAVIARLKNSRGELELWFPHHRIER